MKIFDVVDRLIAAIPLTPENVAAILDARLVRDKESDTAAVVAYALPDTVQGGPWESVDLRMPDDDIGDGSVFLSVTLRSAEGIDQSAVSDRFGTDFNADVPSPRYKPGTVPIYLTYEKAWGSVSFGVGSDMERQLIRFILNAHAAAPTPDDET